MPLFRYQVLDDGQLIVDETEFAGEAGEIYRRGLDYARRLIARQAIEGEVRLSWRVVVRDEALEEVHRIPFWLALDLGA